MQTLINALGKPDYCFVNFLTVRLAKKSGILSFFHAGSRYHLHSFRNLRNIFRRFDSSFYLTFPCHVSKKSTVNFFSFSMVSSDKNLSFLIIESTPPPLFSKKER